MCLDPVVQDPSCGLSVGCTEYLLTGVGVVSMGADRIHLSTPICLHLSGYLWTRSTAPHWWNWTDGEHAWNAYESIESL